MALLHSAKIKQTIIAPDFSLKNIDDSILSYEDIKGKNGTVIAFICNHCPYVHAIIDRLVADVVILKEKGIGFAAIMSNDTENYPADSFPNMKIFADENNFTFPYLFDQDQKIAKAYNALCTPDLFGINQKNEIQYRGRLDSAGAKQADETTVKELINAMNDISAHGKTDNEQFPSMGCSIKWK